MRLGKKILAAALAGVILAGGAGAGNTASAAYVSFGGDFVHSEKIPTNCCVYKRTVTVYSNAKQTAHAKCTSYSYEGNRPTLVVEGITPGFETYSTSFSSKTDSPRNMGYKHAIPLKGAPVKFSGVISKYGKSCRISACVEG